MKSGVSRFLVSTILLVALTWIATAIINPYGVWPKPLGDLYPLKTARINSVRLVKAYDLFKGCPDHLITGMSTVVWGIDPDTYPLPDKVLYNGGIVGSAAMEQYYYVMRYLDQCPGVTKVYLDANPGSFQNLRITPKDFQLDRLQGLFISPTDLSFALFSRSALSASFDTVLQNESGIVQHMVYDRGNGFHRLIESSYEVYYNNFVTLLKGTFRTRVHVSNLEIAYFRQLVNELRRRGIEVVVFFGPTHPFMGYMGRFDGITPGVSSSVYQDGVRKAIADITDFTDFNLYNGIVGEDIAKSDYFIDYIHYRPRLGELVLEVLNGHRRHELPANFGVTVTRGNVDQFLKEYHAGLDHWAADYPQYAKMIETSYQHSHSAVLPEFDLDW
jgi:hypothetical protein